MNMQRTIPKNTGKICGTGIRRWTLEDGNWRAGHYALFSFIEETVMPCTIVASSFINGNICLVDSILYLEPLIRC